MTTLTIQIKNTGKQTDLVSHKIFCADGDNDTIESQILNTILSQAKAIIFNHDMKRREKKCKTKNQ